MLEKDDQMGGFSLPATVEEKWSHPMKRDL